MALYLTASQLAQIQAHAEHTYPEECCGILLGTIERSVNSQEEDRKTLMQVIETVNAWDATTAQQYADLIEPSRYPTSSTASSAATSSPCSAKRDRYWIDPQDLLQAQKQGRDRGLQIIGFYHSHPDHPALPSETDRRLAWAEYAYLIGSVQQGRAVDWQSWRLNQAEQFEAETVVVLAAERGK
ncbi:MAG: M67 family metallopeptidase [Elainella sp. Prado103]|jgi:proteasome lid subunit RPN8/RPN11|nr:M67 family metallopeptidase [Elainella sp. Prado103]